MTENKNKNMLKCMLMIIEMAYQCTASCNLEYEFLKHHLPVDTTDIDLKIRSMKDIHVYMNMNSLSVIDKWTQQKFALSSDL